MKKEITKVIKSLAVPTNILGFEYLRRAIQMCIENKKLIHQMTTKLYKDIAKEYNTTPSRVERAIRHAIEISFTNADQEEYEKYFYISKTKINKQPTNSEYISSITDTICLDMEV